MQHGSMKMHFARKCSSPQSRYLSPCCCRQTIHGKVLMISSILLVLIVELLNSALESAVDHTSLEQHPLAKRAKDIASAAVFLSIVNAAVVWALVIFPALL